MAPQNLQPGRLLPIHCAGTAAVYRKTGTSFLLDFPNPHHYGESEYASARAMATLFKCSPNLAATADGQVVDLR